VGRFDFVADVSAHESSGVGASSPEYYCIVAGSPPCGGLPCDTMRGVTNALAVKIRRLPTSAGLPLPEYQTAGAAGMDLHAAVIEDVVIEPGRIVLVPTGLEVAIPDGFEGQVRPRSGLAVKHGISLPNTPATIDSDYRGEIRVPVINLGREGFRVSRGMRIAQLVIAPVARITWEEVRELPGTARASGGFGHSGV
jgi:dUTP pyrophosphatase